MRCGWMRFLRRGGNPGLPARARVELRAKKAGVKPLPKGLPQGVYLTIVRDPDGNLIELLGPKK